MVRLYMYLNSRFFPHHYRKFCGVRLKSNSESVNYSSSLVAQMVKNLPAMQETRVRYLIQEDPLEKRMATHTNILAWRIPWTEEPGRLWSMGSERVRHD